jgi:hypothetical protein
MRLDRLTRSYLHVISEENESEAKNSNEAVSNDSSNYDEIERLRPDLTHLYEMLMLLSTTGFAEKETEFISLLKKGGKADSDDNVDKFSSLLDWLSSLGWPVSFSDFSNLTSMKTCVEFFYRSVEHETKNISDLFDYIGGSHLSKPDNIEEDFPKAFIKAVNSPIGSKIKEGISSMHCYNIGEICDFNTDIPEYYDIMIDIAMGCNQYDVYVKRGILERVIHNWRCPSDRKLRAIKTIEKEDVGEATTLAYAMISYPCPISQEAIDYARALIKKHGDCYDDVETQLMRYQKFSDKEFERMYDDDPDAWKYLAGNKFVPDSVMLKVIDKVLAAKKTWLMSGMPARTESVAVIRKLFNADNKDLDLAIAKNRNLPADIEQALKDRYKNETRYFRSKLSKALKSRFNEDD